MLHFNAKANFAACLDAGLVLLAQDQILLRLLLLLALDDESGALFFESAPVLDDLEALLGEATLGIDKFLLCLA